MQPKPEIHDKTSMKSRVLPSHKLLIAALLAFGLLAAIILDRVFDNAQWWWLWVWTLPGKP